MRGAHAREVDCVFDVAGCVVGGFGGFALLRGAGCWVEDVAEAQLLG